MCECKAGYETGKVKVMQLCHGCANLVEPYAGHGCFDAHDVMELREATGASQDVCRLALTLAWGRQGEARELLMQGGYAVRVVCPGFDVKAQE